MTRVATVLLAGAIYVSPAFAHVTLERAEAAPGASYKAVVRVPHGCSGSPTLKLHVQVPEGMIAVKPMPKPGWTVTTVSAAYAQTYDFMHGIKMSKGVREITWSGKLGDEFYDEFAFAGFLAEALRPGDTLYFPTTQKCERGSENWTEIPAAGQNPHDLKGPAPMLRLVAMQQAAATKFKAGAIVVEAPWLRATPGGAKVAGGYMKITNGGKEPDRLTGGTLDGAARFEVHEMTMVDSVMRMRMLPNGLEIKPGETVELKPGGFHIMGIDLTGGYKAGQTVKGTLTFEKAGSVPVEYQVAPVGAGGPMHMHH